MNNKNSITQEASRLLTLLPVLMLMLLVIIVGCIKDWENVQGKELNTNDKTIRTIDIDNEKKSIQIELSEITTSEETYDKLLNNCNTFVEDSTIPEISKVNRNNVAVSEDTYVDKEESLSNNRTEYKNSIKNELSKQDAIYLQDKIISVYVNNQGGIKILMSYIEDTKSNEIESSEDRTHTISINEVSNILNGDSTDTKGNELTKLIDINNEKEQNNWEKRYPESILDALQIKEGVYLERISSIITSNKTDEDHKRYFTSTCYEMLEETIKLLKESNKLSENTLVTYIDTGKSDKSIEYKDRIFIQLENNSNGIKEYSNIILKLNKEHIIFDIDVL